MRAEERACKKWGSPGVREVVQDAGVTDPVDRPPEERSARAGEPVQPRPLFSEVYRDCFPDMVRLAYLLTGSAETAEDLVQESFVKLHRRWDTVEEPRPYLRRSVVNACHSHHRRRRRERERTTNEAGVAELGADELSDALERLPYRQRAALVLRFYHDLCEADIAAALRCRPGTVGSLIHRGLAELRKVIEP
jgi:RNA polymerase sigma-70 factor (sigma-E family)